jgi:hypothetical protein
MKYGNVSHTLVQLPELFKNRIKKKQNRYIFFT